MPKYSHAFDIAFEVNSDNEGEEVTKEELLVAFRKRLQSFEDGLDDILEACGLPFDTYEIEDFESKMVDTPVESK